MKPEKLIALLAIGLLLGLCIKSCTKKEEPVVEESVVEKVEPGLGVDQYKEEMDRYKVAQIWKIPVTDPFKEPFVIEILEIKGEYLKFRGLGTVMVGGESSSHHSLLHDAELVK